MKTPEELNALKNEVETMNKKLAELTEEELTQVAGGMETFICPYCGCYLPSKSKVAVKHLMHHTQNEGGERQ